MATKDGEGEERQEKTNGKYERKLISGQRENGESKQYSPNFGFSISAVKTKSGEITLEIGGAGRTGWAAFSGEIAQKMSP